MHQHQHLSMLPQPSGCGDLYHGNPAEYLLRTNPIQRRDHPGAAILSQQFIKNEPNSTPRPSGRGDLYHSNPAKYLLRTNSIQRRDHPGAAILSQQFIKNEPNSTPQPSRNGDLYHGNPVEYLLRTNPIQSRTFHLTALPCASQARPAKEKKCCAKKC